MIELLCLYRVVNPNFIGHKKILILIDFGNTNYK